MTPKEIANKMLHNMKLNKLYCDNIDCIKDDCPFASKYDCKLNSINTIDEVKVYLKSVIKDEKNNIKQFNDM